MIYFKGMLFLMLNPFLTLFNDILFDTDEMRRHTGQEATLWLPVSIVRLRTRPPVLSRRRYWDLGEK